MTPIHQSSLDWFILCSIHSYYTVFQNAFCYVFVQIPTTLYVLLLESHYVMLEFHCAQVMLHLEQNTTYVLEMGKHATNMKVNIVDNINAGRFIFLLNSKLSSEIILYSCFIFNF